MIVLVSRLHCATARDPAPVASRDPAGAGLTGRWARMDRVRLPSIGAELLRDLSGVNPAAGRTGWRCGPASSVAVPLLLLWSVGRIGVVDLCRVRGVHRALRAQPTCTCPACRCRWRRALLLCTATTLGVVVGTSSHRAWLAVPAAALVARPRLAVLRRAWAGTRPGRCSSSSPSPRARPSPATPADVAIAVLVVAAAARRSPCWSGTPGRPGGRGGCRTRRGRRWRRTAFGDVALRHLARNVRRGAGGRVGLDRGRDRPPLLGDGLGGGAAGGHRAPRRRWCAGCTGSSAPWSAWAWRRSSSPSTRAGWCSSSAWSRCSAPPSCWSGRNYALALVAITPLALLMVHLAAPTPASVLLARPRRRDSDRRAHRPRRRLPHPRPGGRACEPARQADVGERAGPRPGAHGRCRCW